MNHITALNADNLPAINEVIRSAISAWPLPPRLRRLATPILTYDQTDMDAYQFFGWHSDPSAPNLKLQGICAWNTTVVHGLYVRADQQAHGIGRLLLKATSHASKMEGATSLLIKAQRVSASYFQHLGLVKVDDLNDYPYTYELPCALCPDDTA